MRGIKIIALALFLLIAGNIHGQDRNVLQTNVGGAILDGLWNDPLGYNFSLQYSRKVWDHFSIGSRVEISHAAEKPLLGQGKEAVNNANSNIVTNNKYMSDEPNYMANFYNQGWRNLPVETTQKTFTTASFLAGYSIIDQAYHGLHVRAGASISKQNITFLVSNSKNAYDNSGEKVGEYVDIVYMSYVDLGYVLDLQYEYKVTKQIGIGPQITFNNYLNSRSKSFKLCLSSNIRF